MAIIEIDSVGVVLVGPGQVFLLGGTPARPPEHAHRHPLPPVEVGDRAGDLAVKQTPFPDRRAIRILVTGHVKPAEVAEIVPVVVGVLQRVQSSPGGNGGVLQAAVLQPL